MTTIPKILHFIWFGKQPKYVKYSIDAFSEMNPDFQINLVTNKNNYGEIRNQIQTRTGKYMATINQIADRFAYLDDQSLELVMMTDIIRMELLNEYGGIYLDCDCFPRRAFDSKILSDNFVVSRLFTRNFFRRDCFFMGKIPGGDDIISYETFPAKELRLGDTYQDIDMKFIKRRKEFMDCVVKPDYSKDFYIEHFQLRSWS